MKQFIAYFDYLGFKQLLEGNDEERLENRAGHILRDLGMALAYDKDPVLDDGIFRPDISNNSINCLNISDTVIFWTIADTIANAKELFEVAYSFNWRSNLHNLPVRGCLIYDSFKFNNYSQRNSQDAIYSTNLMYGKGLLKVHNKVENLNWAGTVIDDSFVTKIRKEANFSTFFDDKVKEYLIPYKGYYCKEIAMQIGKPIIDNEVALTNVIKMIKENFESDFKTITPSVEEKMNNTIKFIESNFIKNDVKTQK